MDFTNNTPTTSTITKHFTVSLETKLAKEFQETYWYSTPPSMEKISIQTGKEIYLTTG